MAAKLPPRLCRVGRARLPSTAHAVARGCRAFQRWSRTRGGVPAGRRATRERRLWRVVEGCPPHATTGHAPIDTRRPEARRRPLDRWIHAPFRALQERNDGKPEAPMAEVLLAQEGAGEIQGGGSMQRSPSEAVPKAPNVLDMGGLRP